MFAISRVLVPSERLVTTSDFSESVRSLFRPVLPEEKTLPNNNAHLDIVYGVDLLGPHLPSLHKHTSPDMLKSN